MSASVSVARVCHCHVYPFNVNFSVNVNTSVNVNVNVDVNVRGSDTGCIIVGKFLNAMFSTKVQAMDTICSCVIGSDCDIYS